MIKPRLKRVTVRFLPHIEFLWWRCEGGGVTAELDTPSGAYALWKIKSNPSQKGLT